METLLSGHYYLCSCSGEEMMMTHSPRVVLLKPVQECIFVEGCCGSHIATVQLNVSDCLRGAHNLNEARAISRC